MKKPFFSDEAKREHKELFINKSLQERNHSLFVIAVNMSKRSGKIDIVNTFATLEAWLNSDHDGDDAALNQYLTTIKLQNADKISEELSRINEIADKHVELLEQREIDYWEQAQEREQKDKKRQQWLEARSLKLYREFKEFVDKYQAHPPIANTDVSDVEMWRKKVPASCKHIIMLAKFGPIPFFKTKYRFAKPLQLADILDDLEEMTTSELLEFFGEPTWSLTSTEMRRMIPIPRGFKIKF